MRNEWMVIPSTIRIAVPATANVTMMAKAMTQAQRAIRLRWLRLSSAVGPRHSGAVPADNGHEKRHEGGDLAPASSGPLRPVQADDR